MKSIHFRVAVTVLVCSLAEPAMAAVVPGYPRLMAMNIGDPAFYGEPEYQACLLYTSDAADE